MKYTIFKLHESVESTTSPDGYNIRRVNRYNLEPIGVNFDSEEQAVKHLEEQVEAGNVYDECVILPVYSPRYNHETKKYSIK